MPKETSMETNDVKEVKETKEAADPAPVEGLTEQQAGDVAGGDGDCSTTWYVGTDRIGTGGPVEDGNPIIGAYEGAINAMSYAMERFSKAVNDE
jgi:hypothetical protein